MPISRISRGVFFLFCLLMVLPITLRVLGTHDWQRAFQCAIAVLLSVVLSIHRKKLTSLVNPGAWDHGIVVLLAALAVASVMGAHQQVWAVTELALVVSCVGICLAVGLQRQLDGPPLDKRLVGLVLAICAFKCVQFAAASLAGLSSDLSTIDVDMLLEGFANRRFYGQFQTFTLPLVALPLLSGEYGRKSRAWAFALLAAWWMIAITGGTRGTWLGMATAGFVMFWCGAQGRRWVRWQGLTMLVGLVLYYLVFVVLCGWLGITVTNSASDRMTTSLSARDIIWLQAWDMIKAQPLLGAGPMQFADRYNPIAAHPHQAILQWASEWGIPSALLVGGLVARGLIATFVLIRQKCSPEMPVQLLRLCLFASLIGALTQSMVDGVIVMPYSQLCLAIAAGWLLAIHERPAHPKGARFKFHGLWVAGVMMAVSFFAYTVMRDFPHIEERKEQFRHDYGGNYQPRFWQQGVIATKPQ